MAYVKIPWPLLKQLCEGTQSKEDNTLCSNCSFTNSQSESVSPLSSDVSDSAESIQMENVGNENKSDMSHYEMYMRSEYGCNSPVQGMVFSSGKRAAAFIRDYCLLIKKKEWRVKGSGTQTIYKCSYNKDPSRSGDCPFHIRISINQQTKKATLKEIDLRHHDLCNSEMKPSVKQMVHLSGPQLEVFNKPTCSKHEVVHSIKAMHGMSLSK